jgi:hypothetical protein
MWIWSKSLLSKKRPMVGYDRMIAADAGWDFTARNERIAQLAAVVGHGPDEQVELTEHNWSEPNMSILNGSTATATAPGKWAGRVKCTATTPPWWQTESVIGVAEVSVAGVFTVLAHVARGRNGSVFVNMPSSKRGNEWVPQFTVDDPDLEREIARVAKAAVQAAALTGSAATAGADDADESPF